MKNIIWTSEPEYDDELHEFFEQDLGDEVMNLNIELPNKVVLVGKLQRWDGVYSVHKVLETRNLGEAMESAVQCFEGDNTFTIYCEAGKMLLSQYGHDNPYNPTILEFRQLKPEIRDEEYDEWCADIYGVTIPLADKPAAVYGWAV
jgi:hypothetical protein